MYLDYEKNQIKFLIDACHMDNSLLANGNSYEKKIYNCISQFDKLVNNSGHNALPPDFYSDDINIMFDLYRVNDSEKRKNYNPTAIAERKMAHEIRESQFGKTFPDLVDNMICIDKDWGSDEFHNINNYINNIKRVTQKHLSSNGHPNKIQDIWMHEHPNITRKGLVVYDETENYFQGSCKPNLLGGWIFTWDKKEVIFYEPWMDKDVLRPIYESSCDFLIWFMPYKHGDFTRKIGTYFPEIVIIDTRFPRRNLIEYDYSKFTRA